MRMYSPFRSFVQMIKLLTLTSDYYLQISRVPSYGLITWINILNWYLMKFLNPYSGKLIFEARSMVSIDVNHFVFPWTCSDGWIPVFLDFILLFFQNIMQLDFFWLLVQVNDGERGKWIPAVTSSTTNYTTTCEAR